MNLLSDLDLQIINYFSHQFNHIASLFFISKWEGAILYISTIAYIIAYPISEDKKTNKSTKKKI